MREQLFTSLLCDSLRGYHRTMEKFYEADYVAYSLMSRV